MRIDGSKILLTGASSGIGAALAEELQKRGGILTLVSRTPISRADCKWVGADLADPAAPAQIAAVAGPVDILINNAGVGLYAPSWNASMEKVREMFEVNLFAAIALTQQFVPDMRERRTGKIVNVASIASKVTLPWFTLYSATKAAMEACTRGLRMELAGTGVDTLLVCPGYVKTAFQANVLIGQAPPKLADSKRFGSNAEAVARAIADGIASDARTVMTPAIGWGLVLAANLAPTLVDGRLRKMMDEAG